MIAETDGRPTGAATLESEGARGMTSASSVTRATPRFGVPPKYLLRAAVVSNAALSLADAPIGSVGLTICSTHSYAPPRRKYTFS
jgi:hypothetical protein